jgi:hypothetical protein
MLRAASKPMLNKRKGQLAKNKMTGSAKLFMKKDRCRRG